jgi:lipopolysaccharide heptosyltransferase II
MLLLSAGEAKRIVVIDWSMIGDLVMLSPAIRAIRQRYPTAHLAVLGQAVSLTSFKQHPDVNQLIPYDRSKGDYDFANFRDAVMALRRERFDLAFIFHNSFGSALMARLGWVKQRVGYRHEWRDLLLTRRFRIPDRRQHLIETKLDLLRMYGIPATDVHEEVHINRGQAVEWLKEKLGPNLGRRRPIVGVSLGATKDYKRWSAASVNAFINLFPVNSCDIVFLGGPQDRELFSGVYSYNNTVVDLVGQTTLEELTWVLDKIDLYVGPDSGPVHLAVGLGKPVVALFGPTDPARCGPYQYEKAIVVRAERICPSCDAKHGKHIRQCLHSIEHEEIYTASLELLGKYCARWTPPNSQTAPVTH